jgi:uncharacterized protein (TIGR00303 family)
LQEENCYPDIEQPNRESVPRTIDKFFSHDPLFVCVISYTETSIIPGITIAGANPGLVKYTSPADAEFLCYGYCKCLDKFPITPDGKPTPAIISRSALQLANIPFLVVDAGSIIKPSIPYVSFDLAYGKNIALGRALDLGCVKKGFEYGKLLGVQLARVSDFIVIGESIPAGTTTALGVLSALGIDAEFKVSSSMPENPHILKNKTISQGMERANIKKGDLRHDPFKAISIVGDPMLPSIAGISSGATSCGSRVMLAGGTQMTAVIAILKSLEQPLNSICIGTTVYVTNDNYSNLVELAGDVSDNTVPVYASDLHMAESSKDGLQAFSKGFVKDGVGAGGIATASILKSEGRINGSILLKAIEIEYEKML